MKKILFLFLLLQAWACKAQMLARSQAIADLDEYNQILNEVHYNPFLYITPAAYKHKTDSLKRSITDSIETKSFLLKLSELTAVLNDGHTMPSVVQPVFKTDFRRNIFLPLSLTADQDGLLHTTAQSAPSGIPTGAAVLTINDVNLTNFYKQAKAYTGGLSVFKQVMAEGLMGNYLYYAGVRPPFRITYAIKGKSYKTTLPEGVILKESLSKAFPQLAGTDYTFEIIGNKVGYLNLISMSGDYKRYEAFFDSCFTAIKAAKIGTVAIDLRQNSGGNSIIGDLLISYLSTKPYSLSGGRYWKVSQRYKNYLSSRGDTGNNYLKQPNNTVIDQRRCGPHNPVFVNNNLLFDGKVYLITGPATFSSAMQLADAVKQYHLATIIGQPTGEATNDFGEVYKFELPHSKIQMQVTTTFDLGADCDAKRHSPVIPDHLINNSKSFQLGPTDAVLEFILKRS